MPWDEVLHKWKTGKLYSGGNGKQVKNQKQAPGKLYSRNRGLLKMSHSQLHDFSVGSEKGKPDRKGKLYGAR